MMKKKNISKKQKEIKKQKRQRTIIKILMLISIILTFYISYLLINYPSPEELALEKSPRLQGIINACQKETLFESATCINKITETFYKYNISNSDKKLNFNELYKQGGACGQWTNYFCSIGEEYGYYISTPKFTTGYYSVELENGEETTYHTEHTFCIWSKTGEGYVILDEKSLIKFKIEESNFSYLEGFQNQTKLDDGTKRS